MRVDTGDNSLKSHRSSATLTERQTLPPTTFQKIQTVFENISHLLRSESSKQDTVTVNMNTFILTRVKYKPVNSARSHVPCNYEALLDNLRQILLKQTLTSTIRRKITLLTDLYLPLMNNCVVKKVVIDNWYCLTLPPSDKFERIKFSCVTAYVISPTTHAATHD